MMDVPLLIASLCEVIAQAYELTRQRLASSGSSVLRMTIERDHALVEASLLSRELAVLRGQREQMRPKSRPDYSGDQRLEIIQIIRLRGWTVAQAAQRFVLHPNTIRAWLKAIESEGDSARLFTAPAWNRIHDAVRWTVQEIRRVCPEPEVGSRSIAAMIVRVGVQISRSSVQRVLREKTQTRPRPPMVSPAGIRSDNLLTPTAINRVWHLDLTNIQLLFLRVTIAAVIDGYSRKLLALRLFAKTPKSIQLSSMVARLALTSGR
jgi:transposase-like protein